MLRYCNGSPFFSFTIHTSRVFKLLKQKEKKKLFPSKVYTINKKKQTKTLKMHCVSTIRFGTTIQSIQQIVCLVSAWYGNHLLLIKYCTSILYYIIIIVVVIVLAFLANHIYRYIDIDIVTAVQSNKQHRKTLIFLLQEQYYVSQQLRYDIHRLWRYALHLQAPLML